MDSGVDQAKGLLAMVSSAPLESSHAQVSMTAALVHATLALVEQQRIANLIAINRLADEALFNKGEEALFEPDPEVEGGLPWRIRPEIREALGLS